ncbi:hypothetical protein PQ455_07555 [Sphingomonas naphthae]|uniref:Uncharacterized protein n=1 Tax=Sphingomonas naphthae TaxID=1813468 RepID=A0ABY7TP96_9SPHN|nr:hypothetical protein [Sphingomonas naphthae]WCT75062.1 hypothetical protein PQ455_07555 [Sphingomonas naphthae]
MTLQAKSCRPTKPFGLWLLDQRRRPGWIGDLARAAERDPLFPRLGMPFDVMARVREGMADGDPQAAVDAAANEWFGGNGWRLGCLIEPEQVKEREAA